MQEMDDKKNLAFWERVSKQVELLLYQDV